MISIIIIIAFSFFTIYYHLLHFSLHHLLQFGIWEHYYHLFHLLQMMLCIYYYLFHLFHSLQGNLEMSSKTLTMTKEIKS